MALSDREQKLLEEMERNLYRSEADVVSADDAKHSKLSPARLLVGTLLVIVGLGILVVTVATKVVALGILAFVIMVAGVSWALRRTPSAEDAAATPKSTSSFSERMNERWNHRSDRQ